MIFVKYLISVVLCGAFFTAVSQPQASSLFSGGVDSLHSILLKEKRHFRVYVPKQEPNPAMATKRFPVIYLLDGEEHFDYVTSLVRRLSEGFTHVLPEMIVVGIHNTDRLRDFTPTHITRTATYTDSNLFRNTGGGPAFLDFLEKELIPHVDSAYPTVPVRTFIGHSLGGLMVVDAMLHRPFLFNAWLSIDPSLWYDNRQLLRAAPGGLKPGSLQRESFFLAIANNLPPGMDTLRMKRDTTAASEDTRAIFDFAGMLRKNASSALQWESRYYPDDEHGSVSPIAIYDGLRYLFREYALPSFSVLTDSSVQPDMLLRKQFQDLSARRGYQVYPPEAFVNELGYALMQKNQLSRAERIFRYNIEAYPKSANAVHSMGDYYARVGDSTQASEYYRKAAGMRQAVR
jgi:predicted alpha/beta superfamily hydrolase